MGKHVVKAYLENDNYKIVKPSGILKNISNLKIEEISVTNKEYIRLSANDIIINEYSDYKNPMSLGKHFCNGNFTLYIDPNWYFDNQILVDNLICFIIQSTKNSKISIPNSCLINKKLIDTLCSNKRLEEVDLGKYYTDGYILTYDDYLKFKNSNIKCVYSKNVDEKLKENFEPIVGYNSKRYLVSYYKYEDLISTKEIYLNEPLDLEELDYLKYISDNKKIYLSDECIYSFDSICNRLSDLNKRNPVIFKIENKSRFNRFIFSNSSSYDNLYVSTEFGKIPLKKYLELEKLLYSMLPSNNLSPFEKYIYVYNITKKYKKYKENKINKFSSRNLYEILENEYMVCVGFSKLFGDLLDKMGIENIDLSVSVDTSYDDIFEQDEIVPKLALTEPSRHARRYVHIVDEKYGIDGFYNSDPTWDNDLNNDYYNHLAFTDSEATYLRRFSWINEVEVDELFNSNSIKEIYDKINFLLDRKKYNSLNEIVSDLVVKIKSLDYKYIESLKTKYSYIDEYIYKMTDDILDLLYDLSLYIVNHVNKEISGETIMNAVENVYRLTNTFAEETIERELKKVLEVNKERQKSRFPKRIKTFKDGHTEVEYNKNKFDIDSSTKKIN